MEKSPEYILIAEDDDDISRMLTELLSLHGYRTAQAFSGTEAMLYVRHEPPSAVILDLMLPGLPGEEVLAGIRTEAPQTAVIVASAKDDVHTRIDLLRAGADDYLTKPFDTGELLARLEAVLRRRGAAGQSVSAGADGDLRGSAAGGMSQVQEGTAIGITDSSIARAAGVMSRVQEGTGQAGRVGASPGEAGMLRFRDLTMYPSDFTAFVGDRELHLTRREYLILELLMGNPGKVFTRSNIYESVWNEEFLGEENAVNVHISNIRQKLAKLSPDEIYIQTVWGIGFKMKQV